MVYASAAQACLRHDKSLAFIAQKIVQWNPAIGKPDIAVYAIALLDIRADWVLTQSIEAID